MNARVTVTVPEELLRGVKRAVASGSAASVSAYVTAALASYGYQQTLGELLDELAGESGEVTTEDRTWARQALGGDMPPADDHVGRTPIWRSETIEEWLKDRPGHGWRRDVSGSKAT